MAKYIIPLFVSSTTKDSYVWGENTWNHLRRICASEGQALKQISWVCICVIQYMKTRIKYRKKTSDECLIDA